MPGPTLTRKRVRLLCVADSYDAPIDVATNKSPKTWRSNDVQFEILARFGGAVVDPSNWQSLTVEVKPQGSGPGSLAPTPETAPLASKTVTDFDATADDASWAAGTKQHAVVPFTDAEWNFSLSNTEKKWIIVTIVTTAGATITLAAGVIEVVEDGYNNAGSAPVIDGSAWSKAEADARYAANLVLVDEAGDARILVAADNQKYIRTGNAAATTITVPPQADVAWPDNASVMIEQGAAGQVTVAAGAGVTISSAAGLKTRTTHSVVVLVRAGADAWTLFGDISL